MEKIYLIALFLLAIKAKASDVCSQEKYPDFLQAKSETGDLEWNEVILQG